jgi:hypothetical protein
MGYEELLLSIPQNMQYFGSLIVTSNYSNLTVRKAIQADLKVQPGNLVVELGYNLQLQKKRIMLKLLRPSD